MLGSLRLVRCDVSLLELPQIHLQRRTPAYEFMITPLCVICFPVMNDFFMGPDKQRRLTLERQQNTGQNSLDISLLLYPPPPDWPKQNGSLYTIKSADRGLTFE